MRLNSICMKMVCVMMMAVMAAEAKAQLLSVKTNALMWGNLTPNLSLELVTSGKTSVEATAFYSVGNTPLKTDLTGGQVEWRYWLSGRPTNWMFVGLSLTGLRYDTSLGSKLRHLGDAGGPGVVYGYVLPLGKHWNIEFAAGLSMIWFRERKYDKDVDIWQQPYNESGRRILPSKLSVSCTYVF